MEQDITKDGSTTKALGKVIQIDEQIIQDHLGRMVRDTVEETPCSMPRPTRRQPRSEGRRARGTTSESCIPERSSDAEGSQAAGSGP